jgi:hypothetical protein
MGKIQYLGDDEGLAYRLLFTSLSGIIKNTHGIFPSNEPYELEPITRDAVLLGNIPPVMNLSTSNFKL